MKKKRAREVGVKKRKGKTNSPFEPNLQRNEARIMLRTEWLQIRDKMR